MSNKTPVTGFTRDVVIFLNKLILFLAKYWASIATFIFGLVLSLAFLAPALMAGGATEAGQAVYRFLAPHDHQMAQRSYFLFSQAGGIQTYSLEQILAWGAAPGNLRGFIGNPEVGFKTALSHRMVAIFIALFGGGLLWTLSYWRPKINIGRFLLLISPMLIDAISHMISESNGSGFRITNEWAVLLTANLFPATFYQGTTIGTLNWLLRTVTGFAFGLGIVWYLFAYLNMRFMAIRLQIELKLRKAGVIA